MFNFPEVTPPRGSCSDGQRIEIVFSLMHVSRGRAGVREDGRVDSEFRLDPSHSLALGAILRCNNNQ
jgi:hypothetical protein